MERPLSPPAAPRLMNGATLVLLCLGLYLPLFWQLPLWRSEAMYALIPQEMLAAGSWLTPTLNGAPYLDKPHLLYWLNMLGYKLLGISAWSARVPTLAMTVGEVWLTYLIGRRLVGRIAAWLGGFILLTCIGFFVLHLLILTDHLVTLSLLAALYALLRWEAQPGFRWTALFFLALVAGFLSKGFIGVVFPGVDRPPLCLAGAGAPSPAPVVLSRGARPGSHPPGCLGGGPRNWPIPAFSSSRSSTNRSCGFWAGGSPRTSTPLPLPGSMCFWASG